MSPRQLRALRGTTAAAVAAWTAAVSHTLAGGTAPGLAVVVVVTLLAAPFAVALAGRRFGVIRLAATVALTQLLLHVTYSLTAGLDPTLGGHVHGGRAPVAEVAAVVAPDALMTAAHFAAALVTFVALLHGERLLRAIAAGVARVLRRAIVAAPPLSPVPSPAPAVPARPVPRVLVGTLSRRGPPLAAAAA